MPELRSQINANEDLIIQRVVEKVLASEDLITKLSASLSGCIQQQLEAKCQVLEEKVILLENQLLEKTDEMEQYTRRNSLRILGIEKIPQESTNEVIMKLCSEKLKIKVVESDIDVSHRLKGKPGLPPPIIVKFVRRDVRDLIFRNKKQLKNSKIVITEDLTKIRSQLLMEVSSKFGRKNVWSMYGNIFTKDGNNLLKFANVRNYKDYLSSLHVK